MKGIKKLRKIEPLKSSQARNIYLAISIQNMQHFAHAGTQLGRSTFLFKLSQEKISYVKIHAI